MRVASGMRQLDGGLRVALLISVQHLWRRRDEGTRRAVADGIAGGEERDFDGELHDVRQREVGHVPVARLDEGAEGARGRAGRRHEHVDGLVREEDALWVARRPARVHQDRLARGPRVNLDL